MGYAIALLGFIAPLWSGVLGVAHPQLPALVGDRWLTRSVDTPRLRHLTQGQALTFVAHGRDRAPTGEPTVTQVYPVRADVLAVEIETGTVIYGQQRPYVPLPGDRLRNGNEVRRNGSTVGILVGANQDILYSPDAFKGSDLDESWADRAASYRLSSPTDARFQAPRSPVQVFRKSKPTNHAQTPQGKRWPLHHTVYLQFAEPLAIGESYELRFQGQDFPTVRFTYEPQAQRSEAVHVSHIGFRPADPVKVGFLSTWMGSGGGLAYEDGLTFWVVDDRTDEIAYTGVTQLAVAADTPEDPYRNYNGTDVYTLPFSEFQTPGVYRLCVATVGCSVSFEIAESVWRDPFVTSMRGLYHQRSGIALEAPYTAFHRPRPFHPDDGMTVFQSTATLMETGMGIGDRDAFEALTEGLTDISLPNAWGGYFDAGDWDRRIQHLSIAQALLELVELAPDEMAAIALTIPESDNDLPDVIDEALWGIDLFRRLQKPDGGIPGGIESAGHPRSGEASWQESQTVMAYAPDILSSYSYAATAAQAAYVLRSRDRPQADQYEDSALRAMAYAEAQHATPPAGGWPNAITDTRNLAAVQLWRLTGRDRWHQLFLDTTVFQDPTQPVRQHQQHNHSTAAFVYARLTAEQVEAEVQANARRALLQAADRIAALTQDTAFQWTKEDPYAPVGWGVSFGSPREGRTIAQAHALTQDSKYLAALLRSTQFALGANPDNLVYTTGLGYRSPQNPLLIDARILGVDPPPGITVYGPLDLAHPAYENYWFMREMQDIMHPAPEAWPTAEAYVDVYINVAMTEFTVFETIAPTAYVWGYLAAQD